MVTNRLSEEVSSSIPIGTKKGPGRPLKAVKGAYNSQPIDKNTKKSELICMFLATTIIFLINSIAYYDISCTISPGSKSNCATSLCPISPATNIPNNIVAIGKNSSFMTYTFTLYLFRQFCC
jgi:hypothetical protein